MAKRVKTRTSTKRVSATKSARKSPSAKLAKKATVTKAAPKKAKAKAASRTTASGGKRVVKRSKVRSVQSSAIGGKSARKNSKKKAVGKTGKKSTRSVAARKTIKSRSAAGVKAVAPAPSPTSQDPIQFPEEGRRVPKTHLKAKELREFNQLLLGKRAELVGDVKRLAYEALDGKGGAGGDGSSMPIHMADLGTDNWEQEFTLGLLASEQALVREIDDALLRVRDKTYGVCLATHNKISDARLRAKPWAKYCIEYARAREEGRVL